jgi:hypothetical protein
VHYRYHGTQYHIEVIIDGPETWNVRRVLVDQAEMPDGRVVLTDDHGIHQVRVEVG